jgi:uncharacterized protein YjbI with pentapeptide repeats
VRFAGTRATGAQLAEAHLVDVVFDGVRLDLASFRQARLERVVFRDCRLEESDFGGARLESVLFERSPLVRATIAGAAFERCELRGCDLAGIVGPEALRGVRMPWADVLASADVLAAAAGVVVLRDE